MQFIFYLSEFLYSGGAGLTQASTSTKNLISWKKYWSPKIGNKAQKQPKKAENSDIKKLGNFDCGGASLKDLQICQLLILPCKFVSFQNDNANFVNRQKMTFFGAQKGLWGGRRGSVFLIFRKKGVKYFLKINLSRVGDRRQQTTKSGEYVQEGNLHFLLYLPDVKILLLHYTDYVYTMLHSRPLIFAEHFYQITLLNWLNCLLSVSTVNCQLSQYVMIDLRLAGIV